MSQLCPHCVWPFAPCVPPSAGTVPRGLGEGAEQGQKGCHQHLKVSPRMPPHRGVFVGLWLLLTPSLAGPHPSAGGATLAFVFDVTGSMYDDLVQVMDGASRILERTLSRSTKPISNYVLVPFHDPGMAGAGWEETFYWGMRLRGAGVQVWPGLGLKWALPKCLCCPFYPFFMSQ